jgi:hypothetical protein
VLAHRLRLLPGRVAVCRLPADAPVPPLPGGPLAAALRTHDELTVVCPEEAAPAGAEAEPGWAVLEVAGPFALTTTFGVLAALTAPLAEARVSVFALSVFSTDLLLVPAGQLQAAAAALRAAGHEVELR